jgi:hypothetical protein
MNGGTPYMSGIRVDYNNPDEINYDHFRSNFPSTKAGQIGDQAWELGVQDNKRIVAGGFHEDTSSQGLVVAAIRICKDPDENPCDVIGIPDSGGNHGAGFDLPGGELVLWIDTRTYTNPIPESATAIFAAYESPAPANPAEKPELKRANPKAGDKAIRERSSADDLLQSPLEQNT